MTKEELEIQKERIEKAEALDRDIEDVQRFCQNVEDCMGDIKKVGFTFYGEKDCDRLIFIETDEKIAKEFAKLTSKFFEEKICEKMAKFARI